MKPPVVSLLVILFGILLSPGGARAQDASTPPVERADPYPPFAIENVTSEVTQTAARIEELTALESEDAKLESLRDAVPALVQEVGSDRDETKSILSAAPGLDLVSDLEGEWATRSRRVSTLRDQIVERTTALTVGREELLTLRRRWKATEAVALENEEPAETLRRIEEARASLTAARKVLRDRLNELLAIQEELSGASREVASSLQAVQKRKSSIRSSLFERGHLPIWKAVAGPKADTRLGQRIREQFDGYREKVSRFGEARRRDVLTIVFLAVACLLATLRFRTRARSWRDEESVEGSRLRLLAERPISTGVLLALILGLFLLPDAPRAVQHTMGLLMLIPLLRILRLLFSPEMHGFLWALSGLYLLDRVRGVLAETFAMERWLLLSEAILAALIGLLLLNRRVSGSVDSGWPRKIGLLLLLSLTASVASNALGFVELARLLVDGSLQTIYAAVAIYAGLEVARSLVHSVFNTSIANRVYAVAVAGPKIEIHLLGVMRFIATAGWLWITLAAFSVEDAAWARAKSLLGASVSFGEVAISLGDVVAFVLTVYGSILLSRFLRFALSTDVYPRMKLERGIPNAISSTVHYGIILIGIYLAVAAAGVDLSRLALLVGALGVGIGFGLQNVVNNFVSGLILLYERPVQLGDEVEVGSVKGIIRRIGIRSSTVRTYPGAEVIVPNADLISNQVTNWTLSDRRRRVEIDVGVAYGSDPDRVRQIMISVAKENPKVETSPAPVALFRGFGDSSLNFQLRAWVENVDDWLPAGSELHTALAAAFIEENIEIPFPQRDLHVRSIDPSTGLAAGG